LAKKLEGRAVDPPRHRQGRRRRQHNANSALPPERLQEASAKISECLRS
jgi:hypothetical protein